MATPHQGFSTQGKRILAAPKLLGVDWFFGIEQGLEELLKESKELISRNNDFVRVISTMP